MNPTCASRSCIQKFRVHILVFLAALILALTVAHPSILLTDEWVTTNQLTQLYEGHQVIINEGRYGSYVNGTPTPYFMAKQNFLAYPLFLPLISLPAAWLVFALGNNFVFLIQYLWAFLLIALALLLNTYFPDHVRIGRWRWTDLLLGGTFVLFFLNLFFYQPFPLFGDEWAPAVLPIALTNIVLFAVLAVMVYEICLTVFQDSAYAIFGTLTSLSCSSFLFWTSFCKDHVLIAFLVTAIILMVVKYLVLDQRVFLSGAFVMAGLLAWARPELALMMAIALCLIVAWFVVVKRTQFPDRQSWTLMFLTPLWTFVGAIPFFLNNHLVTGNIFIPAFIRWNAAAQSAVDVGGAAGAGPAPAIIDGTASAGLAAGDTVESLIVLSSTGTNFQPATVLADIAGVFFLPHSGSMGVFPLVPLFLAVILLVPLMVFRHLLTFSDKEKTAFAVLALIATGIVLAYIKGVSGMNNSPGMFPEIRYLAPLCLPLTLIGLMLLRKIPRLTEDPLRLILGMILTALALLPVSLFAIKAGYPPDPSWAMVFPPLNVPFSLMTYVLVLLFAFSAIVSILNNRSLLAARLLLIILCTLPLIWQLDATFVARTFGSGWGGYSFWIPVVLKLYGIIF